MESEREYTLLNPPPCNTPKCVPSLPRLATWCDYINTVPSPSPALPQPIPEVPESELVTANLFEGLIRDAYLAATGEYESSQSECSTITASTVPPEEEPEEDRRLVNWKKWLARRKEKYEQLMGNLNKPSDDTVLNTIEGYRNLIKRHEVFERAKQYVRFNELRGANTVFWKTPPKAKPVPGLADCYYTLKKSDLVEKPEIEYTQVPTILLEQELNLNKSKVDEYSKMLERDAFKNRYRKFRREFQAVEEHKPEMDDMLIIGEKKPLHDTLGKCNSMEDLNRNRIGSQVQQTPMDICGINQGRSSSLSIQNKFLNEYMQLTHNLEIEILFDAEINVTSESFIDITNIGAKVIDIEWIPQQIPHIFRNKQQHFFFDKNKLRIMPKEMITFKIWFNSTRAGVFKEDWILKTEPNFFRTGANACVKLWGSCTDSKMNRKMEEIEKPIIQNAAKRTVKSMINQLVDKTLQPCPPDPCPPKFITDILFMEKNPKLIYNAEIVEKLWKIAEKIGLPDWDLDVNTLYSKIFDIEDDAQRKMTYEEFKENINYLKLARLQTRADPSKMNKEQNILQLVKSLIGNMIDNIDDAAKLLKINVVPLPTLELKEDVDEEESIEQLRIVEDGSGDHADDEDCRDDLFFIKTYSNVKKSVQEIAVIIESNL